MRMSSVISSVSQRGASAASSNAERTSRDETESTS